MDIMDNTINASDLKKIYEAKQFWIGKIGGAEYYAFYLVISDQRAVASQIAVRITQDEVKRIVDSRGDLKVVEPIARDLRKGYLYVV